MIQFIPMSLPWLIPLTLPPTAPEFSPVQLLPLVLILPLLAFWVWMFRDMINNGNLPDTSKNWWMVAFIFLNVFAAVFYYVYEYKNKR